MSEVTKERAAFAEWLACRHLRFDSRLTQVISSQPVPRMMR